MNTQIKRFLLVGVMILLFSACGPLEATSVPGGTPEPIIATESPTSVPTVAPLEEGSASGEFSQYIGLIYPPSPENLSQSFSMMIQGSDDHSLSLVSDGESRMLWLSQMTHSDPNGVAYWEVQDILDLSNIETGLILVPDGCLLNGQPDNEIFVASKNEITVLAWRANITSNVFEVMPTTGIECHSDKGMNLSET